MKARRKARTVALQALYELDCTRHPLEIVLGHRLEETALEPEIVGIAYNYQGPEWDGRACIDGSASHGLMLIAHYPTINERRGIDPVSDQPGAQQMEDFLRAVVSQAPQQKKPWWVRTAKRLFRR